MLKAASNERAWVMYWVILWNLTPPTRRGKHGNMLSRNGSRINLAPGVSCIVRIHGTTSLTEITKSLLTQYITHKKQAICTQAQRHVYTRHGRRATVRLDSKVFKHSPDSLLQSFVVRSDSKVFNHSPESLLQSFAANGTVPVAQTGPCSS
jgi:hypothetical protein